MNFLKFILFNFFTKRTLKERERLFFLNRRLKTVWIDFGYIISLFFPFFLIIFVPFIIFNIVLVPDFNGFTLNTFIALLPFSLIYVMVLNKDFFNGRSVAKRMMGYKVIDNNTKELANEYKCMLRNITFVVWPIEMVFLLINPQKRLGDIIANTIVVDTDIVEPETILDDIQNKILNSKSKGTIIYSILIALVLTILANPDFWEIIIK